MGGGSSKSRTSHTTNTEVNSTTTTTMRDVGLTGGAAVDMAAVLQSGSVRRDEINAELINNIVQATGNSWNQLIGGAGLLVETSAKVAEHTIDLAPIMTEKAREGFTEGAKAGVESTQASTKTAMMLPMAMIVLLGGIMLMRKRA